MYNHRNQYRCIIIRGKSQKEIDDMLPAYANVIDDITPCLGTTFAERFNEQFALYLAEDKRIKKTLDNHRTEIAGKLFGMYYEDKNNYVYASERTRKFLADSDQPAFFKDLCYKMQFPNGMQKPQKLQPVLDHNISIRPNAYVIKVMQTAKEQGMILLKKEIGYYILNALDVLQNIAAPEEVIDAIKADREAGIIRTIEVPDKATSYNYQHINEQINYLELANLVFTNNLGEVWLNTNEKEAIEVYGNDWNKKPEFDVYTYNLAAAEGRKKFQTDWTFYFGQLSDRVDSFNTTAKALGVTKEVTRKRETTGQTRIEIGDEGEAFVYEYEKKRVAAFSSRLANKVLSLGKTKGLGYDIQSVIAEAGEMSEFVKYIEVKSTKRVTEPDINNVYWTDALNLTRNEWIAAQQHKEFYSIYRVYFVRGKVFMYILSNIHLKNKNKTIEVIPLTYRIDFGNEAVDEIIIEEVGKHV